MNHFFPDANPLLPISMQYFQFQTREVYQNTPTSNCRQVLDLCLSESEVVLLIFFFLFAGGLLVLSVVRKFCALPTRNPQVSVESSISPPPYSSIGFAASQSHDIPLCKGSPIPPHDPFRVVAPSFNDSPLLNDGYFTRVSHPDPVAHRRRSSSGFGSGFGLGAGPSTAASPVLSDTPPHTPPPPPAYVRDSGL
ncbi:hypothetical protein R3P38DRAFT_2960233 [Favolaschia claudopus]|uniref:Uncharacterized protein n=1 Tax=Favolaschia claudopus TaxID=2862362 RepID=A0AAW0B8E6_9AGAR